MDYSAIMRRAWEITLKHKVLWVLGILATLIGAGDFGIHYRGGGDGGGGRPSPGVQLGFGPDIQIDPGVLKFLNDYGLWIIFGLIVFFLVFGLIFSLLGWWLKGGLMLGIEAADRNGSVSLGEALRAGFKRMFPLWLTGFLLNLPSVLIALLGAGVLVEAFYSGGLFDPETFATAVVDPFRFLASLGAALACLVPLACMSVILRFVFSFIETLAVRAVALEGAGVMAGLRRGWALLKANLATNLVLWLLFLVIGVVFSFLVTLPAIALIFPVVIAMLAGQWGAAILIALLGFAALYLAVAALGGVGMAFKWSVWNLAYRKFAEGPEALVVAPAVPSPA